MAKVVRIARKARTFEYEGDQFGLRQPRVKEVEEISRLMAAYTRSLKAELKTDVEGKIQDNSVALGDLTLMTACQVYVAKTLVVAADDETVQIFSENGENIDEVPAEFIYAAWACYNRSSNNRYRAEHLVDVFGERWVRENAYIDEVIVKREIAALDVTDIARAHEVRVKLDQVKFIPKNEAVENSAPKKTEASGEAPTT